MPRSMQEIIDHADELAKVFEDYEPKPEDERDPACWNELVRVARMRSDTERAVAEAVKRAHAAKYSWGVIGSLLGTSGEAARQRYGRDHKKAS